MQSVNSALLFVSFTLCRIVFQVYTFTGGGGIAYMITVVYNLNGDQPAWFRVMLFFMAVSVAVNFCLNCYWYYLICKQVWRMISRGTKADKDFAGNNNDQGPTSEMH